MDGVARQYCGQQEMNAGVASCRYHRVGQARPLQFHKFVFYIIRAHVESKSILTAISNSTSTRNLKLDLEAGNRREKLDARAELALFVDLRCHSRNLLMEMSRSRFLLNKFLSHFYVSPKPVRVKNPLHPKYDQEASQ